MSACGDLLYLEGIHPATNTEIWVLPNGGTSRLLVGGPGWKVAPSFSPNCHSIAYTSDVSGRRKIYVQPYPGPGDAVPITEGETPVWDSSGSAIYYQAGDRMMRMAINRAGTPEKIFDGVFVHGDTWTRHAILAPDGRFLLLKGKSEYDSLRKIQVVLNWSEELKRANRTR
jgi:hypothetical protein